MLINRQFSNGTLTIKLDGRLDAGAAPRLSTEIKESILLANKLVLDFKNLDYIATAGLRILLNSQKTMAAKGSKVVLVNVKDTIMEVLKTTGLNELLQIEKQSVAGYFL